MRVREGRTERAVLTVCVPSRCGGRASPQERWARVQPRVCSSPRCDDSLTRQARTHVHCSSLGFTVVPNFVIGFYEAKELKAHGESQLVQLAGLFCSFLGVGVAFTAVRAISKKEAHSGIGEQGFPVAHFRAVRLLEVMFESVPQAILQTYFAIQSDKLSFFGTLTFGEVLFRLSIMFSLIQVAFFLTSMEVSVRERAHVRARAAG